MPKRSAQAAAPAPAHRLLFERIVTDPALLLAESGADRSARRLAGPAPGESAAAEIVVAQVDAPTQEGRHVARRRGDQLHRPGQRTRPVERRQRPAHDLQALDLGRSHAAEREGAAVLVRAVGHRHAVDQDEREVRIAAPQGDAGQSGARVVAEHPGAGHQAQRLRRVTDRKVPELGGFDDLHRSRCRVDGPGAHGGPSRRRRLPALLPARSPPTPPPARCPVRQRPAPPAATRQEP